MVKKEARIVAKKFSETNINNIEFLIDNECVILIFKGFTQSAFLWAFSVLLFSPTCFLIRIKQNFNHQLNLK